MEEKERYTWFDCGKCVDNQDNRNIVNCIDRLNQQDLEIEALKAENCFLNRYEKIWCDLSKTQDTAIKMINDCLDKPQAEIMDYIDWANNAIKQLKAQEQVVIDKLQEVLNYIENGNSGYYKSPSEIKRHINGLIDGLIGEAE